jgi:molybdate transport system ATP-binding protein
MSLTVDVRTHRDGFAVEATFDAGPGETVALLGPNGAGKSTLVAVVAGLLQPDAGVVELEGRVLDDAGGGRHVLAGDRPVGIVFQDLRLFPHLSGVENAAFPLRARGIAKGEARERSRELLARLGLTERANARPEKLSGGEAQRVALARALIHEPRLLLLDEPLSALDVRARAEMRAVLRSELSRFPGVRVLITHDPVEAMSLADRLVLLEQGRVTQAGTPAEIRESPRTHYAAELVGVNFFAGPLEPLEEGAGRIVTPAGDVVVAWPPDGSGAVEGVIGILRPADVSVHVDRPSGSPRNVLQGSVTSIAVEGERARVRIASSPPVVAEITLGSAERLGLRQGVAVWASFKAVEVQVLSR